MQGVRRALPDESLGSGSSAGREARPAIAGALDRHFQASAYQGDSDLVFCHPHTGRPLDRSKLLKRLKAAALRANVGEFKEVVRRDGKVKRVSRTRFHDLRHTFGTRMSSAGVPLRTIQEWMGHQDFKTT